VKSEGSKKVSRASRPGTFLNAESTKKGKKVTEPGKKTRFQDTEHKRITETASGASKQGLKGESLTSVTERKDSRLATIRRRFRDLDKTERKRFFLLKKINSRQKCLQWRKGRLGETKDRRSRKRRVKIRRKNLIFPTTTGGGRAPPRGRQGERSSDVFQGREIRRKKKFSCT